MISFPSFCIIILTFLYPFETFSLQPITQQEATFSSRFLDSVLQDYAFRSFSGHRKKTGVIYDGIVPANVTGTTISALRLRSGSLRRRGYFNYKEFDIPSGILVNPYVKRVILVYHNLGNWSNVFYPLPGFVYLSPVVGLLGYNAANLTGKGLPELDIRSSENPILIKFETLSVLPNGVLPKCVFFDLFGGVAFDHVENGSVCTSVTQGHFGIVVEKTSPPPVVAPVPAPEKSHGSEYPIAGGNGGGGGGGGGGVRKKWLWIGGSVAGGAVVAAAMVVLVVAVRRVVGRKRIAEMRGVAESGDPLAVAAVGRAKVPVAMGTRTKPILESEYVS
uniref:uncharacterized protein LOC122609305 n=1 Tax=Erigeron canadensis TaxID=72917 RepID=UPI001CB9972D|nr:uncharacterized protein LOC122609305 [Erigeron canadensis]